MGVAAGVGVFFLAAIRISALAMTPMPMRTINNAQYSNQAVVVPRSRKALTKNAAPNQKITWSTVSAILRIGERKPSLNAKISACRMPTPMSNCMTAVYNTLCADGLTGAGNMKVEELPAGNETASRLRKKASIFEYKSGVMAKIIPTKIRKPPKAIAVINPSLPQ